MLSRYGQSVVEGLTGLEGAGVFFGTCSIDVLVLPMVSFFDRSLVYILECTRLLPLVDF